MVQRTVRSTWSKWILIWLVLVASPAAAAFPQAPPPGETIELRNEGGTVTAAVPPKSISPKATLTVICGNGVNCTSVHASVLGTVLTPQNATAGQVAFIAPDSVKPGTTVDVRVCAPGTADAECLKARAIVAVPLTTASGPAGATLREVRAFCEAAGRTQWNEILTARGRADFTVALFDSSGPCYLSRQFGAEGDPIAIGFVSAGADDSVSLDLDPCGTLAATPKVLIGADVSSLDLKAETEPEPVRVRWFQPLRRCFGTEAGIKLTVDQKALAYKLKQFERYRATLQIGVAASRLHQQTFGLRPEGATKRLIETSADERGPEYIASIVLYGVPHYFGRRRFAPARFVERPATPTRAATFGPVGTNDTVVHEPYFGRDPVNENGAADRIGALLGAGMNQPGRRFLAGATFEAITGVNVFLAREFVRTPELEGVSLGSEFAGEASAIPTRDHWRQAWVAGISLDARYALALFGRK